VVADAAAAPGAESLFVVLAGSPGAALRGLARLAAACGDDDAANDLQARAAAMAARDRASPDALREAAVATGAMRPGRAALVGWVAARVEFREKLPDRSSGGVSGCRGLGRAVARGTATHADGAPNPCGVAAAQQPGACWAGRGSASPGHGSRVAAASVSVARKRRLADRAGGDLW